MQAFRYLTILGVLSVSQVWAEDEIELFEPSVKASCVGGTMTIRVDTATPFEGIIHGPNRTEPGCSVQGRGGLKTYLKIDLTKTEEQAGSCGVKYNARAEERRVAIAVRFHPTIEILKDKLYVVTCGRAGFQNSRNEVSVVQLKVTPPSDDQFKVTTVIEGNKYNLRAEVMDHDPKFGIQMRRCFAFDDEDTSLSLVDERGCVIEKLISEFTYDQEKGTADATIYSMFRLPHSNRTYFQCDVAICSGSCPVPDCSKNVAKAGGPLSSLTKGGAVNASDPFERAEDDAVTTSTSVFVAQPGSEAAAGVYYCSGGLGADADQWLLWLCIAFGVLFAIMLLINIFLCSAMTCSCTRSEIIEKEPSIYDDYSIYDSQYGLQMDISGLPSNFFKLFRSLKPKAPAKLQSTRPPQT
eukprot:maker-scaffold140_size315649-snap-gene-1.17 protein:Tk03575 transcript:maker-scaffold140_size315649-snap-gene-1.17-mRNA-1 annotation:"conserved hypothetical protein"